jgi:hypothetical protein
MSETIQIEPSRLGSAADIGSPAQGLSNHGALYSPQVGPEQRKLLDASRARREKYFKPQAAQEPKPKSELQIVISGNHATLCEVEKVEPRRDWLVAATNTMATAEFMVTIRSIQRCVSDFYGVGVMDLRSHRRTEPTTLYRHVAMYLCKELTTNSLPAIGRQFGGRDHTTVLHAFRKIVRLRGVNAELDDQIKTLTATILAKPEPAGCE